MSALLWAVVVVVAGLLASAGLWLLQAREIRHAVAGGFDQLADTLRQDRSRDLSIFIGAMLLVAGMVLMTGAPR